MKGSKLKMYKRFELRMFWVHSDSGEPKVLHVLCHCYAAINIFIKIFNVLITFSYNMNYVPNVVATDLEVHFSVLKKGVSQYFCLYSICTSHWCLVMSFWLKVCIYSHTRGVKLGLGLGFMQTSQFLPCQMKPFSGEGNQTYDR